ncbi:MAG: TIR domain-containing protein [Lachnospiraceae bacterium]
MNGYVFISYSSKDERFVNDLTAVLKNNEIKYWKAPESISPGSNYAKEIPKAIAGCTTMILVVSASSQQSIWVEKEVDAAVCARKVIIPVQIDETPLNDMYRFYLNNVQMITYAKDLRGMMESVTERIRSLGGSEPESDKTPVKDKTSVKDQQMPARGERSNALRMNRIPVRCDLCDSDLEQVTMGIYRCNHCQKEYYDDFQKIRNYLEKAGSAPATIISRATGVPLKTIRYFFNEEFLEIPQMETVRMSCQQCGTPIRTGILCDRCKLGTGRSSGFQVKDGWYSGRWKR